MKKLLILLLSLLISFNSFGVSLVESYENGNIYAVENYKYKRSTRELSVPHGKSTYYYENGGKLVDQIFQDGNKVKETGFYEPTGFWIWKKINIKKREINFIDCKDTSGCKRHGTFTAWNEDGELEDLHNYKYGNKDGKQTNFGLTGEKYSETFYKNGKAVGKWTFWHSNGQKKKEGSYKNDEKDGKWTFWNKNGQIESEKTFKNGKCVIGDC